MKYWKPESKYIKDALQMWVSELKVEEAEKQMIYATECSKASYKLMELSTIGAGAVTVLE